MSSSAEPSPTTSHPAEPSTADSRTAEIGWDEFAERPGASDVGLVSPMSELASVLQRYRSDVDAALGKASSAVTDAREVAVEQAVLVAQFAAVLDEVTGRLADAGQGPVHKRLRILKDQMLEVLRSGGITVDDPIGRPLTEVSDQVEVVGWLHRPEFTAEVVAKTHEAIVLHRGALVRRGEVIVGAPQTEENQ
jgi:hypothetical protein